MLASASPRKPSVERAPRSARERTLLVACRRKAMARSSGGIPRPSSATSISSRPAPSTRTAIRVAPASTAFSISSLTTAAGRWITSPAAIASATSGASTSIRATAGCWSSAGMLTLPGIELVERLLGRQAFQVQLAQLLEQRLLQGEAQLVAGRRLLQGTGPFQLLHDLPGPHAHLARQAGQLGDVNPVAALRD